MGQSATKSGVVIWGPSEFEDSGWDGGSAGGTGSASAGNSAAGAPPLPAGSVPQTLQLRLVEGLKAAAVRAVAAGPKHFACLAQTGELYMWGSGAQGQLGLGDCSDVVSPKILRPVPSKAVHAVSCGSQHTACVLQDGSAYTWGCALHGRLGLDGLKLPRGGAVLGEGGSDLSQLVVPTPQHVRTLEGEHISAVSCGAFHTAFLVTTETGTSLYTCGLGLSGRLGHGDEEDRHVPEKVQELEAQTVLAVACGGHHSACITSTGLLYTWGGAAFGKLGLNTRSSVRVPTRVEGPLVGKVVVSVALGTQHSACTTADGELYTWGQGRRLGHEERGEADEPLPRQVQALFGFFVTHVACGEDHTLCLLDSGDIWAWGTSWAFGHGDQSSAPNAPTPLRALRGKGVSHIACGGSRSVALCNAGHVPSKAGSEAPLKGPSLGSPGTASLAPAKSKNQPARHTSVGREPLSAAAAGASGAQEAPGRQASQGNVNALPGPARRFKPDNSHAAGAEGRGESSADLQIAQLSRELQAARVDSLLLAALLKGAATELDAALRRIVQLEAEVRILEKCSADAGERLATLRRHYEQHIKELGQQLAQQDVQFHAALAARSCAAVSSGSHGTGGASTAALSQRLSLEAALADPLGSQGPSLFMLPPRESGSSPESDRAGGSSITLDSLSPPAVPIKGGKLNQGLMLCPKGTEPFALPFPSKSGPTTTSAATRQQHQQQADSGQSGEDHIHTSRSAAALQGAGSSPAIPIFVLDDNENP